MASIEDEKRKAMEAEMSRFEQEILGPSVPGVPIMSSGGTTSLPATSMGQVVVAATLPATVTQSVVIQTRPAFIPHQVQIRHQPNPPQGPPQHAPVMMSQMPMAPMPPMGPPMMTGPPMGNMMAPSMGPPGGMMQGPPMGMQMAYHPPQMSQPAVLSKPPTMYSAPPVKFNKKPETQVNASGGQSAQAEVGTYMSSGSVTNMGTIPQDNTQNTSTMQGSYAAAQSYSAEPTKEEKSREGKADKRKKKYVRTAAGLVWEDDSLNEWDNNDFRIFCGDLGNEVTDELLTRVFSKFPSFTKAKVVRDKRTNKTKGFGFVSFKDPNDFMIAMREMNGRYVGNRPIKLRKSTWSDRNLDVVRKKHKEKERLGLR